MFLGILLFERVAKIGRSIVVWMHERKVVVVGDDELDEIVVSNGVMDANDVELCDLNNVKPNENVYLRGGVVAGGGVGRGSTRSTLGSVGGLGGVNGKVFPRNIRLDSGVVSNVSVF